VIVVRIGSRCWPSIVSSSSGSLELQGLLSRGYVQLSRHATVLARVERIVAEKNARLPSYARIKRFAVSPTDLSEESGELTPTLKVRRKLVAERYAELLEGLYTSHTRARH
jgi:long-chain acyl-CoA synthetase